MNAEARAAAAEFYDILEEMLFIAAQKLHDTPRRNENRDKFVTFMETTAGEE